MSISSGNKDATPPSPATPTSPLPSASTEAPPRPAAPPATETPPRPIPASSGAPSLSSLPAPPPPSPQSAATMVPAIVPTSGPAPPGPTPTTRSSTDHPIPNGSMEDQDQRSHYINTDGFQRELVLLKPAGGGFEEAEKPGLGGTDEKKG